MTSDALVLVSYIEVNTNSICCQKIFDILKFSSTHIFRDIQNGYEIELDGDEILEDMSFLKKDDCRDLDISSIKIRKIPSLYKKKYIPAGGELFHMVYMGKGLSAFSMRESDDEEMVLDEQKFCKFVKSGVMKKRVILIPADGSITKYILYYLIDEVWRADIYESLKRHLAMASWTDHLGYIESVVLGYIGIES